MEYRRPLIVGTIQASTAISVAANGSNPLIKKGVLEDFIDICLHRSTSGAYQADE
jgi:hypothetical protein